MNNHDEQPTPVTPPKFRFPIKKIILSIFLALLLCLLYLGLGTLLPFLYHKDTEEEYRKWLEDTPWRSDEIGTERVLCIDDNTDALLWRLRMFDMAENEIIVSTFDMRDDESGKDVMAALFAAAERGVSVKLFIDGFGCRYQLPESDWFRTLAAHEGVTIQFYNPINLLLPWKSQCRLHDKYVIVDNACYLLGGRNTYNVFLGDYPGGKNEDREVFVYDTVPSENSSLTQLRDYFEEIWTRSCNEVYTGDEEGRTDAGAGKDSKDAELYLRISTEMLAHAETLRTTYAEAYAPLEPEAVTMPSDKITLVANPPEPTNKEPRVWSALMYLMMSGESALIQTPYVICSDEMYADLTALCAESEVNIITNSVATGSNPFGCVDYEREEGNILATGVTVFEYYGKHPMHMKTILIDHDISIIGSYNMDMRSTYINTELMLVIDSAPLNELLRENAKTYINASRVPQGDGTYHYGENWQDATPSETLQERMRWIRPFSRLIRHLM